jgi:hypothetical protein
MNPFAIMQVMNQFQQIRQNPNQLGALLKSRGLINDQQVRDISQMGTDYTKVGQYLMNNRIMPQPDQQAINQAQQVMQNSPVA